MDMSHIQWHTVRTHWQKHRNKQYCLLNPCVICLCIPCTFLNNDRCTFTNCKISITVHTSTLFYSHRISIFSVDTARKNMEYSHIFKLTYLQLKPKNNCWCAVVAMYQQKITCWYGVFISKLRKCKIYQYLNKNEDSCALKGS